ncbi:hypothetical protein OG21DRAFT_639372 [Imleria badia]|nr:hypothetical protein OG21DRAFT_639372 [Imleria badia]
MLTILSSSLVFRLTTAQKHPSSSLVRPAVLSAPYPSIYFTNSCIRYTRLDVDTSILNTRKLLPSTMSAIDQRVETCNALMVPDLFYTVLDRFHPEFDPMERQALVALAQTCSAFSEPALDRLWRKLRSLEPLIRCYTTADQVDNAITPTASEFTVIDRYACRIRELVINDSASVCFLQCTSMRASCLLPNLMALEWNPSHLPAHAPVILIQKLLSPTLVSLKATLTEADVATIISFFDNYPFLGRNLRSVEIWFSDGAHSAATAQALSRAICSQKALEKARLGSPIDDVTLRYLSALPTLKVLRVSLAEHATPSFSPTGLLFCSVEELEFTTTDLDLVTNLLQPDQTFHSFCLNYRARLTSKAAGTLFNVLTSRSNTKPLQQLTLSAQDLTHPLSVDQMTTEAPRYRLTYDTLTPLMVFGSLRCLQITWGEQISLDDDEVANLARSWPLLQTCHFNCDRGGEYPPFLVKYPTLRGLLSLVTSCPELESVCLPIDATHVPEIEEVEPCPHIECLFFPESPIDEALPVAEFLFQYFPCMTILDATFKRMPGTIDERMWAYERAWAQVDIYLDELHTGSDAFELASIYSDDEDDVDDNDN